MVNIIELIKKEIIVGPGLIAFAWNSHNQEAEASRVQGRSEVYIETRSQKERMAGEGTGGRRENGTVEEKNYFQSVLNKKGYIFLKSMDLIKSHLVLFFSVIQNALVTSVLHFPYTPLSPVLIPHTTQAHPSPLLIPHTTHSTGTISRSYFLNWNILSSVTAWLPPMCPLHRVFGKGKVMLLRYIRVPSHESDRNHIQRTLRETLWNTCFCSHHVSAAYSQEHLFLSYEAN